jgi:hypothetical protein
VIQFGMIAPTNGLLVGPFCAEPHFWTESTANWAQHEYAVRNGNLDSSHYGRSQVQTYLSTPQAGLSACDRNRDYGITPVAAYLEELLPSPQDPQADAIRQTFDALENDPLSVATNAIRSVIEGHADVDSAWLDYAEVAYEMSFADVTWAADWQVELDDGGNQAPGNPTGGDALGGARPAREADSPVDVAAGDWNEGERVYVGDLGMAYVDLLPGGQPGNDGTIQVEADGNGGASARLVPYQSGQTGPTPCAGIAPIELDFPAGGSAYGTVRTSAACPYATLIVAGGSGPGLVSWKALFVPGPPADTFDRTTSDGWGSGPLGTWATYDPSYDQYLSVDGGSGIANQKAPDAVGDITVGLNHVLTDPSVQPIDITYTFTQSTAAPSPGGLCYVDDQFVVEETFVDGFQANTEGAWVSVWQPWCGSEFRLLVWDPRVQDYDVTGSYTPPVPGAPLNLRLRLDEYGIQAKLWAAAGPEPTGWTSTMLAAVPLSIPWTPRWLAITPSQTVDAAIGPQTFRIDGVVVESGFVANP